MNFPWDVDKGINVVCGVYAHISKLLFNSQKNLNYLKMQLFHNSCNKTIAQNPCKQNSCPKSVYQSPGVKKIMTEIFFRSEQ